jgi:hypothetical protein
MSYYLNILVIDAQLPNVQLSVKRPAVQPSMYRGPQVLHDRTNTIAQELKISHITVFDDQLQELCNEKAESQQSTGANGKF